MKFEARHEEKVLRRRPELSKAMRRLVALTWLPGDRTNNFLGKLHRPLGSPMLVAMSSSHLPARQCHEQGVTQHKKARERIDVIGYKTAMLPDGSIAIGGASRNPCAYDFGMPVSNKAVGRALNTKHNPEMCQVAFEMDLCRERYARTGEALSATPILPSVRLGFKRSSLPPFEETPALRRRAAARLGLPEQHIAALPDEDRIPLLKAEWKDAFIWPENTEENETGLVLLACELTSVRGHVRKYEHFADLVGVEIPNPMLNLISPKDQVPNPCRKVAARLGIDYEATVFAELEPNSEADARAVADGDRLLRAVKQSLGSVGKLCSGQDLLDMLYNPDKPLIPSGLQSVSNLPDDQIVELMCRGLGRRVDLCTRGDLLRAAHHPNENLLVRGMCRIQVLLRRRKAYGPEELGRERTTLDITGTRAWGRKGGHAS